MIKHYDIEESSRRVKYTVRGTYLLGNDKVAVEHDVYINGDIFGSDILKSFTKDEPVFAYGGYNCIGGDMQIDIDDFGFIKAISVFNDDGREIFYCYNIETLQQYLIAVEIVKVQNLEE